jgi:hypothetical protein
MYIKENTKFTFHHHNKNNIAVGFISIVSNNDDGNALKLALESAKINFRI